MSEDRSQRRARTSGTQHTFGGWAVGPVRCALVKGSEGDRNTPCLAPSALFRGRRHFSTERPHGATTCSFKKDGDGGRGAWAGHVTQHLTACPPKPEADAQDPRDWPVGLLRQAQLTH